MTSPRISRRILLAAIAIAVWTLPGGPADARSLYSQQNLAAHTSEVYWISADQHVNVFWNDGSFHWADLTHSVGGDPAAAGSALTGVPFNGKAGTTELYYITSKQHLAHYFFASQWLWEDLMVRTVNGGVPNVATGSGLAATNQLQLSATPNDAMQLYWICANQHICKLNYDGAWHWSEAMPSGSPNAAAGSALSINASVVNTPPEIYYFSPDQHVNRIWFATAAGQRADVTTEAFAAVAAMGSDLNSALNTRTNQMEIYYAGPDQRLYELYRPVTPTGPTGSWKWMGTISNGVGAPPQSISGGVSSQRNPIANTYEVYYVTTDQKIKQLWSDGTWHAGGMTDAVGGPLSASASGLSSQFNAITQHSEIYHLGADLHVYYFWYDGNWHPAEDITGPLHAPIALP